MIQIACGILLAVLVLYLLPYLLLGVLYVVSAAMLLGLVAGAAWLVFTYPVQVLVCALLVVAGAAALVGLELACDWLGTKVWQATGWRFVRDGEPGFVFTRKEKEVDHA